MYGLPIGRDRYSSISDAQLDQLISDIMQVSYTRCSCGVPPTLLSPSTGIVYVHSDK